MPDPRSVMKEFRFLDQKRQAQGLTADEEVRYGELRDLVGGETGASAKPGFDVSAAAARLRESLMPAGLRNRPPPTPEPSPEPFGEIEPPAEEPAPEVEQEQPYAPAGEEQAQAEDLFDPGSLAAEGTYDPNAAAYDPNAAAYDPNAAAYDPNAAAYDPNAAAYDPNAAAYDPNAAAYDPNAAAYDPNAAAYDPNAAAYDPNAAAYDPNAAAYDPNAAAYDPNAAAYDPNVAAYDPNASAYDPNAAAYDPNAAEYDPNAVAYDPNAAAATEPGWGDAGVEAGAAVAEAPLGEEPAWAPAPGGEYDGASWDAQFADPGAIPPPAEEPIAPPPGPIEFGSYDDAGPTAVPPADLESLLPFDPAAEAQVGPEMAETFAGGLMDLPGANDLVDQHEFHAAEGMASHEAPEWQPEPGAVDQGFELASGGSFDASAEAAAPEWASAPSDAAGPMPWDPAAPGADAQAGLGADTFAAEPEPEQVEADAAAGSQLLDFSGPELSSAGEGEDPSWAGGSGQAPAPLPGELDATGELEPTSVHAPFDAGEDASAAVDLAAPSLELGAAAEPGPDAASDEIPILDADALIEMVPAEGAEPAGETAPPIEAAAPQPAHETAASPATGIAAAATPEPDLPVDVLETPEADVLDPGQPADDFYVAGAHRVVVHTLEGQVKRGFIENADLAAPELSLAASQGGSAEAVATDRVKAIFFMLAPGEQPVAPHGSRVRVLFRDGRQVAGFSPDYREGAFGFYMIPADSRTSTGRIWVYQAAVKQVSVS
jgi:hypothetical protein